MAIEALTRNSVVPGTGLQQDHGHDRPPDTGYDAIRANEEVRQDSLELRRLAANTKEATPNRFTTSIAIDELKRFKINGTLREAKLTDVIFYWSSTTETANGPIICVRGSAIVHGVAIEVKGFGANEGAAAYRAALALAEQSKKVPARENPPAPNTTIELRTSIELPEDMRRSLEQQLSTTRLQSPVMVEPSFVRDTFYFVEAVGLSSEGPVVSITEGGRNNQEATARAIRRLVREDASTKP